jgi:hypothetical protein
MPVPPIGVSECPRLHRFLPVDRSQGVLKVFNGERVVLVDNDVLS